jgi:hypothetical protein
MILMARETSGDSSQGVPGIIFRGIQESFTTQGLAFGSALDRIPRCDCPAESTPTGPFSNLPA